MRIVEVKVYEFNELSEKAKERAVEKYNYLEPDVSIWKIIKEFETHFGLKVESRDLERYFKIRFDNDDYDDISTLNGERLYRYIQNNFHDTLYKRKEYGIVKDYRYTGKKRVSRILYEKTECPFTGLWLDESLLEPVREFMRKIEYGLTLKGLMERCVSNLVGEYKEYIEYLESEEHFAEYCEANDWEFFEDGTMYNG